MSATQQPEWKLIAQLGDASPLDYGGYFIFLDITGVYNLEAEKVFIDDDNDPQSTVTVYRFPLEQCTYDVESGVLSDNRYHPQHPAWFADRLDEVARTMGYRDTETLAQQFVSHNPIERAIAWQAVGDFFGYENLDEQPLRLTMREAKVRYKNWRNQL